MPSFRYVSENPYRLLGLGSAAPYKVLRREAAKAEKAAAVGLSVQTALLSDFGNEDLEGLVSRVSALTNDPVQRTLYRCFWPFAYAHLPKGKAIISDLLSVNARPAPAEAKFDNRVYGWHNSFLVYWFRFLTLAAPDALEKAFEFVKYLQNSPAFAEALTLALEGDGGAERENAVVVSDAQARFVEHLLATAAQKAAELWSGDLAKRPQAVWLLHTITASGLDEDAVDQALKAFGPVGDAEAARLNDAWHDLETWTPTCSETLDTSDGLRQLSIALGSRLASVPLWQKAADNHTKRVGWLMRSYSVDRANEHDDYQEAARVLHILRANKVVQSDSDFAAKLENDWQSLSDLIADAAVAEAAQKAAQQKARTEAQKERPAPAATAAPRGRSPQSPPPSRLVAFMNSFMGYLLVMVIIGVVAFLVNRTNGGQSSAVLPDPSPSVIVASPSSPPDIYETPTVTPVSEAAPLLTASPMPQVVNNPLRMVQLQAEWDTLKKANADAASQLNTDEQDLKNESDYIEQQGKVIDRDRATLDRFDHDAVARFNKNVENLNEKVRAYKRSQADYNRKVKAYNGRLERLKEIRAALEQTGN